MDALLGPASRALAQDIDCLLHRRRALQVAALRGSCDTSRAVMAVSGGNSLRHSCNRPGEGGAVEGDDRERGVVMDGPVARFEDRVSGPRCAAIRHGLVNVRAGTSQ